MDNEQYFSTLNQTTTGKGDSIFDFNKLKSTPLDDVTKVEVYATTNQSSLISSHTEYHIRSKITNNSGENQEFDVPRRFSDFEFLHDILAQIPGVFLSYFPEKNYIDKMEPYIITQRKNCFDKYLKTLVKTDLLFINRLFCMFLSLSKEEFKLFKNSFPKYKLGLPSGTSGFMNAFLGSSAKINTGGFVAFTRKIAHSVVLKNQGNEYTLGREGEYKITNKELFQNGDTFSEIEEGMKGMFAAPDMSDSYIGSIHEAIDGVEDSFDNLLQKNEDIVLTDSNPLFARENLKEKIVAFFGIHSTEKVIRAIPSMISQIEDTKEKMRFIENAVDKVKKIKSMSGTEDDVDIKSASYKNAQKISNNSNYNIVNKATRSMVTFFDAQQEALIKIAESYEDIKEELYYFYNEMLEIPRLNKQFVNFDIMINRVSELSHKYQNDLYQAKTIANKRSLTTSIEGLREVSAALKIQKGIFVVNFENGIKVFNERRDTYIGEILNKFKTQQKELFILWNNKLSADNLNKEDNGDNDKAQSEKRERMRARKKKDKQEIHQAVEIASEA